MLRSRWTPAQTGTQGLFRLVKQAHETYKAEVSTLQKSYKRYALDFIHSNQFHDEKDAWSKNEHQKNYYTITDLLREHEKLVCKYFNRNKLDDAEIADLLNEFYVSDLPKTIPIETGHEDRDRTKPIPSNNTIESVLDKYTIDLIVQLANEVGLFKEKLDADDVAARYATDTLRTMTSRNNTRLVVLLDKLASSGIIPYHWQAVIAKKKLVVSSSGRKYLDQHDMSSTLNRSKETPPGISEKHFLAIIDKYIRKIKSKEV